MTHTRISKQLLLFNFFLFLSASAFSQTDSKLSFLFAGDVMQHGGQIAGAYNKTTNSYDYDDGFKFIKPLIEEKDIAIANLEVTHAGKPYKGYPQFSAPDELSKALLNAGFDILLTSNNHACDGGAIGVVRTLDILDEVGIKHTGTFRNKAERDENYPLIIEEKGIKVALLNYTFSTNGISVEAPVLINYIDSVTMKQDFAKAKKMNVDYIICSLHWGTEYESLPSSYQFFWEKFCYKQGADMIVGGHPHVLQPVQKKIVNKKERLTIWSLGNFVSNQRDRYKNGGLMITANICKEKNSPAFIDNVESCFTYVHIKQEGVLKPFYILPDFNYNEYRSDFISPDELILMKQYFADSRKLFSEHSIGVKEKFVNSSPKIVDLYKDYLLGYYTVLIEKKSNSILPSYSNKLHSYLHKIVYQDGSYGYVSGVFRTSEEAIGNKNFLLDCKIENKMKIIFVAPQEIKIIQE
jgi:poly-gamma-glutamate synthesis protein (capsule biosynthesis protein)